MVINLQDFRDFYKNSESNNDVGTNQLKDWQKLRTLCSSIGYPYDLDIYHGKAGTSIEGLLQLICL